MIFSFIKKLFHQREFTLPKTRGEIRESEPLAKKTWLGVGGEAEFYFEPADEKDLAHFIKNKPDIPVSVLGGGSNILIRDSGVAGVVIHLGKPFANVQIDGTQITCGAGLLNVDLSRFAAKNNLSGFEFLCGIPGSVGGALRMNAGAYGREIKDILISLRFVDSNGTLQEISPEADFLAYRQNRLPDDWIFTGATFQGIPANEESIFAKMAELKQKREANQPIGVKTCGSTFKNPEGLKAWQLIEKAGCRGLTIGDACISEKHTNFIINKHHATAQQLEDLGEEVIRRVREKTGITLEWEIKRWGTPDKGENE